MGWSPFAAVFCTCYVLLFILNGLLLRLHVEHHQFLKLKKRGSSISKQKYSVPVIQHSIYMLACLISFVAGSMLIGHTGSYIHTYSSYFPSYFPSYVSFKCVYTCLI